VHFVDSYSYSIRNVATSHSKNVGLANLYLHVAVSCLRTAQTVKICPALCGTRRFITVFTTASPRLYTKPENSTPNPYIMLRYKMYLNYALLNASGTLQAISYQRIFQNLNFHMHLHLYRECYMFRPISFPTLTRW
jgi:hypothetical protein